MKVQQAQVKPGILLVDKPSGITSHDVVDAVRKKFKIKQVGHAGTLDPLATGVLVLLIGKATKLFSRFSALDKKYQATLKLGVSTITGDTEGAIISEKDFQSVSEQMIHQAFAAFQGTILQSPPMVSALRHKGKRLYELARQGEKIEIAPRTITVYDIRATHIDLPLIHFLIHCSKGTYVRKIAEDIGEKLGCGACITEIRRVAIGALSIEQCVRLEEVDEKYIQDPAFYFPS